MIEQTQEKEKASTGLLDKIEPALFGDRPGKDNSRFWRTPDWAGFDTGVPVLYEATEFGAKTTRYFLRVGKQWETKSWDEITSQVEREISELLGVERRAISISDDGNLILGPQGFQARRVGQGRFFELEYRSCYQCLDTMIDIENPDGSYSLSKSLLATGLTFKAFQGRSEKFRSQLPEKERGEYRFFSIREPYFRGYFDEYNGKNQDIVNWVDFLHSCDANSTARKLALEDPDYFILGAGAEYVKGKLGKGERK